MSNATQTAKPIPLSLGRFAILGGAIPAILVALDQLSKWATTRFFNQPMSVCASSDPHLTFDATPIVDLSLLCNRGISWGMLQGDSSLKRWGLTAFAFVMTLALLYVLRKTQDRLGQISLSLVIAGAVGNAIDRLLFGAVTDMIDFSDIKFNYVFNVADSYITVGERQLQMLLQNKIMVTWREANSALSRFKVHIRGFAMLRTTCLYSALASVALIATGCASTSRALGLEKSAPNEFNILTKAPLIVPPEYNLRPPAIGASSAENNYTQKSAREALLGNVDDAEPSNGEIALMAKAGVNKSNPEIRLEIDGANSVERKSSSLSPPCRFDYSGNGRRRCYDYQTSGGAKASWPLGPHKSQLFH